MNSPKKRKLIEDSASRMAQQGSESDRAIKPVQQIFRTSQQYLPIWKARNQLIAELKVRQRCCSHCNRSRDSHIESRTALYYDVEHLSSITLRQVLSVGESDFSLSWRDWQWQDNPAASVRIRCSLEDKGSSGLHSA